VDGSEIIPFISSFYFYSETEVIVSSYGGGLWKLVFSPFQVNAKLVHQISASGSFQIVEPLVINLKTGTFVKLHEVLKDQKSEAYRYLLVQQGYITDLGLSNNQLKSVNYSNGTIQLMDRYQKVHPLSITHKKEKKPGTFSNNAVIKDVLAKGLKIKGVVMDQGQVVGLILSEKEIDLTLVRKPYVYLTSPNMLTGLPKVLPGEKLIVRGEDFYPTADEANSTVAIQLNGQTLREVAVNEEGYFQTEITIDMVMAVGDYLLELKQQHGNKTIRAIANFKVVVRDTEE
jgi:hypothetical protein